MKNTPFEKKKSENFDPFRTFSKVVTLADVFFFFFKSGHDKNPVDYISTMPFNLKKKMSIL